MVSALRPCFVYSCRIKGVSCNLPRVSWNLRELEFSHKLTGNFEINCGESARKQPSDGSSTMIWEFLLFLFLHFKSTYYVYMNISSLFSCNTKNPWEAASQLFTLVFNPWVLSRNRFSTGRLRVK